ncbi:MAG TPA: nucleoside-diphosphate sugar epimerase/dehydratase [Pelobium sp.]|nr:nucleoside-diphosphate sugar epimerase/dehydratase [Pelobium sp.]
MKNIIFCDRAYSRWAILFIDTLVMIWAFTISTLIINKFQIGAVFTVGFLFYLFTISLVSLIVFMTMRIHTGIIRYSNTEDILRVFKAVIVVSIVFLLIEKILIAPFSDLKFRWLNFVVVSNFFISTSLLVVLRIGVKSLFAYLKELESDKKENILIYGSDKKAILIKQAFEASVEKRYNIIGFIDDFHDRINKNLEQKKVYSSSSIPFLTEKNHIDKMVVMDDDINLNKDAVKTCITLGIKVISVPASSKWLNGHLNLTQVRDINIEDLLQRAPIDLKKDNIFREMAGKRVLVTGAAGSIGSEIVRQLLNYKPEEVILCDQAETPLHELQLELEDTCHHAPVKIFMANIQNLRRLRSLFNNFRPEIVFHAAAFKHVPMMESHPSEAVLTNVLGTKNLADLSVEFKVKKFIMISTDKAVNPTNIMGASKRLAEMYTQSLNAHQMRDFSKDEIVQLSSGKNNTTKFITTRFGNVLGSNGSVVPRFKNQIEKGGPITITHPLITRYFMTIPEAVQLVLEASAMGRGGEIFIFDMGKPIRIVDMATNMIMLAGLVPHKDIKIVFTGLRPGEKLYEELLNKEECTSPTYHDKIKISGVRNTHFFYVKKVIEELLELTDTGDCIEIVKKMKEIVPEFKSKNSIYNKLDKVAAY